jgi:hypothetical protein
MRTRADTHYHVRVRTAPDWARAQSELYHLLNHVAPPRLRDGAGACFGAAVGSLERDPTRKGRLGPAQPVTEASSSSCRLSDSDSRPSRGSTAGLEVRPCARRD